MHNKHDEDSLLKPVAIHCVNVAQYHTTINNVANDVSFIYETLYHLVYKDYFSDDSLTVQCNRSAGSCDVWCFLWQ